MTSEIASNAWRGSHALRLMQVLCREVGPRPSGSAAIAEARKLLANEFASFGAVGVHEEEVPVRRWHPGTPLLVLLGTFEREYACVQCLFTAAADIEAPLVDAGSGTDEDFTRVGCTARGAAALIGGQAISGGKFTPVQARIASACNAGCSAVILRSTAPTGLPAIEAVGLQTDAALPCLSVSSETGSELASAAESGTAKVHIRTTGASEPAVCANLIADLAPDDGANETIVLGAHLDSFWNAPGALDNLTGVVAAVEIARLLSPFRPAFRRTLRLIAYTGEEIGCLGSKSYIARQTDGLDGVRFVVNMDSLFPATARGTAVMWSAQMCDHIRRAFGDAGRDVDVRNLFCMSSDYLPFMLQGIPVCRPADWENSMPIWWHTESDDLEHVSIDWIRQNAMVYAQLLARMLTDPEPLPAKRLSPAEVRGRLEEEGVVEWLRLQGHQVPERCD